MTKELHKVKAELKLFGIDSFFPEVTESMQFKRWNVKISPYTCIECLGKHMKIISVLEIDAPPIHHNCHCVLLTIYKITVGTATIDGLFGADAWIKNYSELPNKYISKDDAKKKGWRPNLGNLQEVINNAVIGGEVYYNKKGTLPSKEGRIWYEADVNYTGGYRNMHRIVYSNDGLMFVTYDHYDSFYEVK